MKMEICLGELIEYRNQKLYLNLVNQNVSEMSSEGKLWI